MIFIRNKVFDSATGKILAVYDPPAFDNNPIISVDYNSIYHLIAISSYAKNVPLLICHYEENSENDLELGLDMFASMPSKIKLNVPLQLKPIKKSPERSQSKIRHHSRDNSEANSLRLWDLIVKMDSILKNAKQGKTRLEIKNLNGKLPTSNGNMYKVQNKVENQNSKLKNATDTDTYSIDLTNFHQVMNERDISKENSEQEGTYNVKKDKFVSPTEDENNSPKDAAFEDSSTLSQAESLEDDCQTYSIHLEK